MAKNGVDGVYTDDPRTVLTARRYRQLSYQEAIERDLRVMDASALAICRENGLPILVFNMREDGAVLHAVTGEGVGTLVSSAESILDEPGLAPELTSSEAVP